MEIDIENAAIEREHRIGLSIIYNRLEVLPLPDLMMGIVFGSITRSSQHRQQDRRSIDVCDLVISTQVDIAELNDFGFV